MFAPPNKGELAFVGSPYIYFKPRRNLEHITNCDMLKSCIWFYGAHGAPYIPRMVFKFLGFKPHRSAKRRDTQRRGTERVFKGFC